MTWLSILAAYAGGVLTGCAIYAFATWNKVRVNESHLRQLANDISVMNDMGHPVPTEWLSNELDSMIAKDYR